MFELGEKSQFKFWHIIKTSNLISHQNTLMVFQMLLRIFWDHRELLKTPLILFSLPVKHFSLKFSNKCFDVKKSETFFEF